MAFLLFAAACGESFDPATVATPAAITAQPAARTAKVATDTGTVTLITGDRVTVRRQGNELVPTVEPGPGRAGVEFAIERNAGKITVVPDDMADLVDGDRVDGELFNVTRLLAEGFGDDQRGDLPLIITGQPDLPALHSRVASADGMTVVRTMPTMHMLAVRQHKGHPGAALASLLGTQPAALTADALTVAAATAGPKIWLDHRRKVLLDHSVPQIGAPAAYARGFTGAGITIGEVDTGIDTTHPDLNGDKVVAAEDFVGDGFGTTDPDGHGTHVASILAGTGAASGGQFHGVAFDAHIANARVCDIDGFCLDSAMIAGMEWAVTTQHVPIISMSIGEEDTPGIDPVEQTINQLSTQFGTLIVVAAGNDGDPMTINSPSSADAAFSVGAVDVNNQLANFSSIGPRVGDHAIKPDITAPGVNIIAARATGTALGPIVNDFYIMLSGTSMATPHVAASAAILLQQHPDWTGEQLKRELMNTAQPTDGLGVYEQGAGRVDLDRATRHAVSTEPGSESFGQIPFPHDQDPPSMRTIEYHNDGAAPVTLALAATLTGPDGSTTPGMVSVAPASITVPAGGTADATVTINTALDEPAGVFGGTVVATGDDLRIITPIGIDREAAAFKLKVQVLDHQGEEVKAHISVTGVAPFGTPIRDVSISENIKGHKAFHLLAGTYTVTAFIHSKKHPIFMIAPRVDLSKNTTAVMDGQLAKPVKLTLPDDNLALIGETWCFTDLENGLSTFAIEDGVSLRTAQIGAPTAPGSARSFVQVAYGDTAEAPTKIYNLAHREVDQFLTGWKQTIRPRELATVLAHHAGRDDRQYVKSAAALDPQGGLISGPSTTYAGPFDRTELFFGPEFQWGSSLSENIPAATPDGFPTTTHVTGGTRTYLANQTYHETWNQAVLGPTFAGPSLVGFGGSPERFTMFMNLNPSMDADASEPGRGTTSGVVGPTLTLFRNGTQIAQASGPFSFGISANVGAVDADFRLDASLTRPAATFDLSTQINASWSFHSAPVTTPQILALPSLRFAPPLDEHNRTAAAAVPLPIHVARPDGAATPVIATITVDASFDDGATWTAVPVAKLGDDGLGIVTHPPGATFVSLRGTVVDVNGTAETVTILRAFGLTP